MNNNIQAFDTILEKEDKSTLEFSLHSTEELLKWLSEREKKTFVSLNLITLEDCKPWFYDNEQGMIRNLNNSFFQIQGIKQFVDNELVNEQPIIIQNEIGFLGIICRKINGVWHYLMQAKIEPGNINIVQLSPTIQATKSNFTCKHGGREPRYLSYFKSMKSSNIIVDQIQSEQSSRFYKKRNRNVIVSTEEEIEETDFHKWMTLRQIKELMRIPNLVNMDTRTVLSCIPYVFHDMNENIPNITKKYIKKSATTINIKTINKIYNYINNLKMFDNSRTELVSIKELTSWNFKNDIICCKQKAPFNVVFCNIEIEGREVTKWNQPLFRAEGKAVFGLICKQEKEGLEFLVKITPEVGCFDNCEIGPSIQIEAGNETLKKDIVSDFFFNQLRKKKNVMVDVILSEEGGRFYHEENRNVILFVDNNELVDLPENYIWSDYGTLNVLTQINNCLNIQLRNLLSLLEL